MLIHSSCNSTSPHSTSWSLKIICWVSFPLWRWITLSVAREPFDLGWTDLITPSGPRSMRAVSTRARMSMLAWPIGSSWLNLSLSKTSYISQSQTEFNEFQVDIDRERERERERERVGNYQSNGIRGVLHIQVQIHIPFWIDIVLNYPGLHLLQERQRMREKEKGTFFIHG